MERERKYAKLFLSIIYKAQRHNLKKELNEFEGMANQ